MVWSTHTIEPAGDRVVKTFRAGDHAEHAREWRAPSRFRLTPAEAARYADCRRLLSLVWIFLLLGDDPDHPRNPPGHVERRAAHLLRLLP